MNWKNSRTRISCFSGSAAVKIVQFCLWFYLRDHHPIIPSSHPHLLAHHGHHRHGHHGLHFWLKIGSIHDQMGPVLRGTVLIYTYLYEFILISFRNLMKDGMGVLMPPEISRDLQSSPADRLRPGPRDSQPLVSPSSLTRILMISILTPSPWLSAHQNYCSSPKNPRLIGFSRCYH